MIRFKSLGVRKQARFLLCFEDLGSIEQLVHYIFNPAKVHVLKYCGYRVYFGQVCIQAKDTLPSSGLEVLAGIGSPKYPVKKGLWQEEHLKLA